MDCPRGSLMRRLFAVSLHAHEEGLHDIASLLLEVMDQLDLHHASTRTTYPILPIIEERMKETYASAAS